jgi:hypothetical protein
MGTVWICHSLFTFPVEAQRRISLHQFSISMERHELFSGVESFSMLSNNDGFEFQ